MRLTPARIYLGVGTKEGEHPECDPGSIAGPEAVDDVIALSAVLQRSQASPQVQVTIEPCAVYNEAAWALGLPAALAFLTGA
ncbi:MAG: hypothetical protein E4H38_02455 [Gemmatimonadales bacterium]|nr:MAG: hypothetical protein E4H38_02455 [Gemmatimonadales bacterium]